MNTGNPFIIRRGGAGGIKEPFAVIGAHYKVGATCICSDGVTILTAPEDASGDYTFFIPNAGTWVITATLDEVPVSQTVVINRQYQYEQVLLDRVYLLRNGVSVISASDWAFAQRGSSSQKVNLDSNGIYFSCNYQYGRGSAQTRYRINFGLTPNYTTLHATYGKQLGGLTGGLNHVAVGYTDVLVEGETDIINSRTDYLIGSADVSSSGSTINELSLDVSNVTREHYIALWVGTQKIYATDLWLE